MASKLPYRVFAELTYYAKAELIAAFQDRQDACDFVKNYAKNSTANMFYFVKCGRKITYTARGERSRADSVKLPGKGVSACG